MSWSYRLFKDKDGCFFVGEAYYDDKKRVWGWIEAKPSGETKDETRSTYLMMAEAFLSPVLDEKKLPHKNADAPDGREGKESTPSSSKSSLDT